MSTFSPFRQFIRIARMTTTSESKKPLLALPATAEETVQTVGVNDTFKLKELGPVVINEDGAIGQSTTGTKWQILKKLM
ncbi:unnamed protein product [Rhizopus microsporus]